MSFSRTEIVRRLRRLFRQVEFQVSKRFALSTREDRIFFALVPTVGLVAGGLAVIVQRLSEGLRVLLWGYTPSFEFAVRAGLSGWRVLLALVTGGVLVAILQRLAKAPLASHGVSSLVESVALHGGRLSVKPVLYSAAAAIATVGSGGSLGREGPMLRLGAAVSSWLGQRLGLSSRRLKILLGCGTAAGFAAAFNVPIGGSLFAMEVVLGSFALEIFGPIVVAAVLATLLSRAAESAAPIYPLRGLCARQPLGDRLPLRPRAGRGRGGGRLRARRAALRPPLPQGRRRAGGAPAGRRPRPPRRPGVLLAGGARATASRPSPRRCARSSPGGSWRSSPA